MKRKLFSLLVLLLTAVTGAWAQTTYTVAGSNSAMFGTAWDASNTTNDMTKNGDGTYSITYTNVYLDDNVQYKVVKDHSWNEAYPDGDNRVITIAEAGTYTLTIHFNPNTHEVYETMPGVAPTYDLTVGENAQGSVKFYVGEAEVTKAEEGATVTVVITPNTGWVVNQPSGQWYAAMAKAPRRTAGIDMLKDFELTKLLGQDNTWSFVMQRANAEVSVTYKKLLTNSDITVEDIADLTYNGLEQTPTVTVKDGSTVLTLGTDYTVSYSNNKNAGLSTAENAPTVTITAVATSQKYAGSTTKTFTIKKKALTVTADNKSVTFGDNAPSYSASYSGFVNGETASVLGGTLGFSCEYVKNVTAAGTYDITPSGLTSSNYDITFTKGTLTVGKKALEDGFIADIDALTYTSEALQPAPVVTFNGMTLEKDADYTVAYSNNVNAGTATVTVTAVSTNAKYSGSAQKNFTINPATLTAVTLAKSEFTYNFTNPQLQTATAAEVKAGNLVVPATDYDITDNTATELGTYTAKVKGKNNFQGEVTADFAIVKEEMGVDAEDSKTGKEVDDVTMTVSVVDRTQKQLTLDVVNVPAGENVIVEIPAQINGWDVIGIADGAITNNVTDVYMPNTGETPITVTDAAMGLATVHVDIQLLDNYAKMLPTHVGEKKVVSEVKQTAKRFWSFSCGVDVELPEGVTANIVKANSENQVISEPIKENVVKANNGVLLEGEEGVEYQITALPAASVGNDYEGNLLEPVIEKKHYGYGQGYYILKDGKFYAIANDAAEIPSCKAVLHIAGANARVIDIISFDETTGLSEELRVKSEEFATATWYDLNGRKLNKMPTKKGVYILNGKKVVVK